MIQIEVRQLPPAEYSPNARCHWAKKLKAGRLFHDEVFWEAIAVRNLERHVNYEKFPWNKAELLLTIVVAQQRRRDMDNWLARCIPGINALRMAGLIVDDDVEHLAIAKPVFVVDKKKAPRTIFELSQIGGER